MTLLDTTTRIDTEFVGRKYILPIPLTRRFGVLPSQSPWQINRPFTLFAVTFKECTAVSKMTLQGRDHRIGKRNDPILGTFPIADSDCTLIEIDILDP